MAGWRAASWEEVGANTVTGDRCSCAGPWWAAGTLPGPLGDEQTHLGNAPQEQGGLIFHLWPLFGGRLRLSHLLCHGGGSQPRWVGAQALPHDPAS